MLNKQKLKLKIKKYIADFLPYVLYSKFSIHRNFYASGARYGGYSAEDSFGNLGAGRYFFHERWKCFDFYDHEMTRSSNNYINWDFREEKNLPGKYKLLYCSHVAEHIPRQNLKKFLDIAFRALEPGGAIRFCIPDADLAYEAYMEKRIDFFEIYSSKINELVPSGYEIEFFLLDFFATAKRRNGNMTVGLAKEIQRQSMLLDKLSFLDWIVSGVEENSETGMDHVNWLNFEKMSKHLKESGFETVYKSGFAQSKYAPMRDVPLFDGWLPSISFYIEAVK